MTSTTNPALMNDFGDGPKAGKKPKGKDDKKKKRKDKNKGKQDDLQDAQLDEDSQTPPAAAQPTTDKGKRTKGSTDEFTSSSDKKNKQEKKNSGDDKGDKDEKTLF